MLHPFINLLSQNSFRLTLFFHLSFHLSPNMTSNHWSAANSKRPSKAPYVNFPTCSIEIRQKAPKQMLVLTKWCWSFPSPDYYPKSQRPNPAALSRSNEFYPQVCITLLVIKSSLWDRGFVQSSFLDIPYFSRFGNTTGRLMKNWLAMTFGIK